MTVRDRDYIVLYIVVPRKHAQPFISPPSDKAMFPYIIYGDDAYKESVFYLAEYIKRKRQYAKFSKK